ncbi:hypothetical protein CNMCM8927_000725 [Aspergillus lentulus]|uniref:argininosuccinate synthase n=1 Tax=Aspergillus lentulus TaxID=293939 RepID=A0AAN6BMQ2_ASPLE|nr:hypothetical protein CNMCM8060_006274 [Aspergillus lentulus]KAF4176568.1 hypothetical protein CNMCM8060_006291 [Aspergillus lentulus]KAF4180425.1 hypothetical protein CNMCM7927_001183 [Aspergillus lentulus]KAF4192946.1 hypothetical protein CNMCM8694_009512 [Aspergillus lentulus]KAF4202020.1 hypothetical protein CNMCM8927_000725 [Aspergillus lentulus]
MGSISSPAPATLSRIESFEQIEALGDREASVVTMFSGGLDSTYLLFYLHRLGFKNVYAVAVDVGEPVNQGKLTDLAARFNAKFVYLDGKDEFVEQGIKPAIRAHASYLGMYPLSSSLSRPVIARLVADYAKSLDSKLLLHTANLSQNSLRRLNNSIQRSGFSGLYGSPYVRSVCSRQNKAAELAKAGLAFMSDRKLSCDENLWCREFESGPLDDPEGFTIPEDAYVWTQSVVNHPPEKVKLGFESGQLVSVNDQKMALIKAIALLNNTVGKFGHGRFVGLEPIITDEKVLEVREAPAAAIIMDALRHLEVASLSTKSLALKQELEQKWALEAITGQWASPVHTMCDRSMASILESVSGTVTYVVGPSSYLPCSIIVQNPRYVRDRDDWELQTATNPAGLPSIELV